MKIYIKATKKELEDMTKRREVWQYLDTQAMKEPKPDDQGRYEVIVWPNETLK